MDNEKPNSTLATLWYLTDEKLQWATMGDVYDISIINGDKVEWNRDLEITIQNLLKHFPKDEEKIRKYFKLVTEGKNTNIKFLN